MKRSNLLMIYVGMMLVAAMAVACASGDVASGESATETPSTMIVDPTATSVAATASPVPEPTVTTDPLRNPEDPTVLPSRVLPAGLDPEQVTEQPTKEQVIALWTEYITDSLLPIDLLFPNIGNLHFCDDGVAVSASGRNDEGLLLDQPHSWSVSRNAAMSSETWWEAVLTVNYSPESGRREPSFTMLTLSVTDGLVSSQYHLTDTSFLVYESEYCEQVVNGDSPEVPLVPKSPVVKVLPAELRSLDASQPVEESAVLAAWTKFFTDSYFDPTGFGEFFHFCRNGVIVSANPEAASDLETGVVDAWRIDATSAAQVADWWEARFVVRPSGSERFATFLSLDVLDGQASGTFQSVVKSIAVYESEYCEQVVKEPAREIPALLISENFPNPAVRLSLWVEYLQGGILRSLDGRQTLEICTSADDSLKGRATGDLLMEELLDGDKWGAQPQFAQAGSGWDHPGLVFTGPSLAKVVAVGYNLELIDGVPTLVHNPDATHPFFDATSPYWRVPDTKLMPFEVIDGADCL